MAIDSVCHAVPEISISLAPEQQEQPEAHSPFTSCSLAADEDSYRSPLLTPPGSASIKAAPLSPLRPADAPVKGQGLERERFEVMLRASRERNMAVGARKQTDLRKEIAIKAHHSKQMERRALFLSKVRAPPSPSAADTPKTPPESPSIFHYTLPSPGLESPLAVFESIALDDMERKAPAKQPWVEHVDFNLPEEQRTRTRKLALSSRKPKPLPSLDQITARITSQRQTAAAAPVPSGRLPAFLQSPARKASPPPPVVVITPSEDPIVSPKARHVLPIGVGRLRMPVRVRAESGPASPSRDISAAPAPRLSALARGFANVPAVQVSLTQVKQSQANLAEFESRARTRRDMLSTLRRRTVGELDVSAAPAHSMAPGFLAPRASEADDDDERKSVRRRSAPPELQECARVGFTHPVLALPGAF